MNFGIFFDKLNCICSRAVEVLDTIDDLIPKKTDNDLDTLQTEINDFLKFNDSSNFIKLRYILSKLLIYFDGNVGLINKKIILETGEMALTTIASMGVQYNQDTIYNVLSYPVYSKGELIGNITIGKNKIEKLENIQSIVMIISDLMV